MSEKPAKNTFITKLWECCSNDQLRPLMQCVHFSDGLAYASDGMVIIRQTLEYHSILEPEFLEGKSIHKNNYKAIMAFENAVCNAEGIECYNTNGQTAFFAYYEPSEEMKTPNFEAMFRHLPGMVQLSGIGIDIDLMARACKALFCPSKKYTLQFTGIDSYILVEVDKWPEQTAIVMSHCPEPTLPLKK